MALNSMPEYRRRLPHLQPEGVSFFVTWRLAGSLPRCEVDKHLSDGQRFVAQDRMLDRAIDGPVWLKNPEIADMVASAIIFGERDRGFYLLQAWAIMPNHVHVLIAPTVPLAVALKWLKGSTAHQANMLLNRKGAFWRDESYDRWVRNREELGKIAGYIERNPVSAGLVAIPGAWRWSSASGLF